MHPKSTIPQIPSLDYFWAHVDRNGPLIQAQYGPCWNWLGDHTSKGYGRVYVGRRARPPQRTAHRIAWEMASGEPIPPDRMVLHVCDCRTCVRNDEHGIYVVGGRDLPRWGHLFLGTALDNSLDMATKGRSGAHVHPDTLARGDRNGSRVHPERLTQVGVAHWRTRFNESDVVTIRTLAASGSSFASLGRSYGITPEGIAAIVHRKTWKHVP